jgi:hypothetical protein
MTVMLDRVPQMSAAAADFIAEKLANGRKGKRYIIEYGSGGSTLYFVSILEAKGVACNYVAVERSHGWFEAVANALDVQFHERKPWGLRRYLGYLLAVAPQRTIPAECRRLGRHKIHMLKRLPRDLLSRRLGAYFCTMRYRGGRGAVAIDYVYVYEGFKDQFGESPNRGVYINEPLADLLEEADRGDSIWASVIVDGGPRADIVDRILSLAHTYPNVGFEIFLLDAGRPFYSYVLDTHPSGVFVPARENVKVDGGQYLQASSPRQLGTCEKLITSGSLEQALATDLWYWTGDAKAGPSEGATDGKE